MMTTEPQLAVLICAHNPLQSSLERTLEALRAQNCPSDQWELLLIDNASKVPLAGRFDLSWHPPGRHLAAPAIGKTNAFLMGVRESTAPIILIVDDDNVLAPDYLEAALAIASRHPDLGAWGGNVKLCFQEKPPEWTRPYWSLLAERTVTEDAMVCNLELNHPLPVGAGCCVRRAVAERYAVCHDQGWRVALGRVGLGFGAGEDTDLIMTACEMGLQRGVFRALHLDHLIPPHRVSEDYLVRMTEGVRFSGYFLELARHPERVPPMIDLWWHIKFAAESLFRCGRDKRFFQAYKGAQKRAREFYEANRQLGQSSAPHLPGDGLNARY